MLTAFVAIIKDSFRAAMASRVLYVLLAIITLVLLVLAPLHVRENLDWKLSARRHFQDEVGLALKLHSGSKAGAEPALKKLWEGMSTRTRETIARLATAEDPRDPELLNSPAGDGSPLPLQLQLANGIENDLNGMLASGDLYEEGLWGKRLGEEARGLVDGEAGKRTAIQQRRLNRLLITGVLTPELSGPGAMAMEIWYGPWNWEFLTSSVSRSQFHRGLAESVSYIVDKFVMSIGLFIAILVTSSLIPEMFEPGSLNLLLSKPVPRWLLLLGKFVGGSSFIALCALYLFLGIWLWMGLATGLWDRGLLWSIPLYVLVFAIYFSVSMLVGILYRSPIVSVILAVIFWGACFAIGATRGVFHVRVHNDRLIAATRVGELLLASDCKQRLMAWNPERREWEEAIGMNFAVPEQEVGIEFASFLARFGGSRIWGPVPDPEGSMQLVATPGNFDPEGRAGGPWELYGLESGQANTSRRLGILPSDTVAMVGGPDGPVLVSSSGQLLRWNAAELPEPDAAAGAAPQPAERLFVKAGPDKPEAVRNQKRVAANPGRSEILTLNRRTLTRLVREPAAEEYVQRGKLEIQAGSDDRSMAGWLETGGRRAVAAWGNGVIEIIDLDAMKSEQTLRPVQGVAIERLAVSGDGQSLVVLYRDGRLLHCAASGGWKADPVRIAGVREITGVDWDGQSRFLVSHGVDRVTAWNPVDGKAELIANPKRNWLRKLYDFAIQPFYRIAPKPGEFYKLVTHLSASAASRDDSTDWTQVEWQASPWAPLWSGLGFMAVMLGISCWLFSRGDY